MSLFFGFLFEIFVLISANVITANSALVPIEANHAAFNSSSVGSPDPEFHVDVAFEGPRLRLIAVLASIVGLLVDFGLQDFSGSTDAVVWRLKEYPDVQIVILPDVGGTSIERRFIIWGISQAAGLMINSRRFQTATITLKWKGESAGRLLLKGWPPLFNTDRTELPGQALENILFTENIPSEQFDIGPSLDGSYLNLLELYRTVVIILVNAAPQAATERVTWYASPANLAAIEITILQPSPAPTQPPYFENQWLIRLMAAIPDYMIRQGVFMEGIFLVTIGGISVANAFVEKKMPVIASGLSNVSVS